MIIQFSIISQTNKEVYSRQMLSGGIITVSKNKKVMTNELFSSPQILHHAPNSAQDSGNN